MYSWPPQRCPVPIPGWASCCIPASIANECQGYSHYAPTPCALPLTVKVTTRLLTVSIMPPHVHTPSIIYMLWMPQVILNEPTNHVHVLWLVSQRISRFVHACVHAGRLESTTWCRREATTEGRGSHAALPFCRCPSQEGHTVWLTYGKVGRLLK